MSEADAIKKAQEWEGLDGQDYASKVSDPNGYEFSTEGDLNVVALDFGIKTNILRNLAAQNMKVTVLPSRTACSSRTALPTRTHSRKSRQS